MAKYRAMATKARSPPERRVRVFRAFPGGWTRISMPQFRISLGSSRISSPRPPPKSSVKVSLKLLATASNSTRNIFSISPVSSETICSSSSRAFSMSSRWPVRKVYRSFTRSNSSMAPRLGLPMAFISRRIWAARFWAWERFSRGCRCRAAALRLSS